VPDRRTEQRVERRVQEIQTGSFKASERIRAVIPSRLPTEFVTATSNRTNFFGLFSVKSRSLYWLYSSATVWHDHQAQQAPGQRLQPTALVHEAWLRLVGTQNPTFKNRSHFFSAAAEAMRHILIDRARRKQTERHGGGLERVDLDNVALAAPGTDDQLLAVHDALDKFALNHPLQAEVVKLRYFTGMTNEEWRGF